MKIAVLSLLVALQSFGGMSYQKPAESAVVEKQKETAVSVEKTLSTNDISGVTRLRVEGASFRKFNFFLPVFSARGPLSDEARTNMAKVYQIIKDDLGITGNFTFIEPPKDKIASEELMKQLGAEGISRVEFSFSPDKISATIEHKNLMNGQSGKQSFVEFKKDLRKFSHLLSKSIFENYIGPEDLFLLQIAAIKRNKNDTQLVLMDFDGQNQQQLTKGIWGKATPYFSPDGKSILYTIISKEGQGIVEQVIGATSVQFLTKKDGLNLDPRVLPNNKGILATLSYNKNPNIYYANRDGTIVTNLTESTGFNLSPSLSADGKLMTFVSTRAGSPQIYEQVFDPNGKKTEAKRLTFQGRYNQTPHYSPDSEFIVFTGRDEKLVFDIFLYQRKNGTVSRITQNNGRRNQEPIFTPSGRFVIFVSERPENNNRSDIYLATLNGQHQYRLTRDGGYLSPVVRPKQ